MVKKYIQLNRDVIKYIAMLFMLICHIVIVFRLSSNVYIILKSLGYFSSVIMPYFLVEGYHYTKSKSAYFLRLFVFGLISQIPFALAFGSNGRLNMFFTLCICFCIVWVTDNVSNVLYKSLIIGLLILASERCDWTYLAPVWTLAFIWGYGSLKKTAVAFAVVVAGMAAYRFTILYNRMELYQAAAASIVYVWGMALAGVVVVFFYNGKRAEQGRNFSKWFFYIFYPVHLVVLWLLRQIIL